MAWTRWQDRCPFGTRVILTFVEGKHRFRPQARSSSTSRHAISENDLSRIFEGRYSRQMNRSCPRLLGVERIVEDAGGGIAVPSQLGDRLEGVLLAGRGEPDGW